MSTWGSWSNEFHRYSIPSCPLTTPSLCVRFGTPPLRVPPCPFTRGDVRSSISQPGAGDDMDNLACEFCPALDMVLRLHAPLQVWHASDEGVNAGVEILNNFHRVLSLLSGRKTITLIKVRRGGGEQCWKCSDFPWSERLQHINGAQTACFPPCCPAFLLSVWVSRSQLVKKRAGSKSSRRPGIRKSETRMEGQRAKGQLGMSGGHCPPGREITSSKLDGLVDTAS